MKIAAYVPIKLKSQRLPDKMLLPIGGKPMCYYIFDALLKADIRPYVFCSDAGIVSYLPEGVRYLKRDADLDKDETLGMEIYRSFAEVVKADYYLLCHATSPFTKVETLIEITSALDQGYDSAFTVSRHQTFAWHRNKPLNYDLDNVVRTQDLEPVYLETSAAFLFSKEHLAVGRRIGYNPKLVEVDSMEAIDIDTINDYRLALAHENNSSLSN